MGKAKLNIPMCAALVLLLLTMISVHLTSGLYARYTTTATGSDSARVAKFDVVTALTQAKDGEGKDIEGQFTLMVTNNSEVAVKYQVAVTLHDHLDVTIEGAERGTPTVADNKKTIPFSNERWTLAPGAMFQTHTLRFEVSDWSGITSEEKYDAEETVTFQFDVAVTAEQID